MWLTKLSVSRGSDSELVRVVCHSSTPELVCMTPVKSECRRPDSTGIPAYEAIPLPRALPFRIRTACRREYVSCRVGCIGLN